MFLLNMHAARPVWPVRTASSVYFAGTMPGRAMRCGGKGLGDANQNLYLQNPGQMSFRVTIHSQTVFI